MKSNFIFFVFFISVVLNLSCLESDSNPSESEPNAHFYVFYDVTEWVDQKLKNEFLESTQKIFNYLDLDSIKGGTGFGEVHFELINSEYFRRPVVLTLRPRDWNENEIIKKNKVKNFIESYKRTLSNMLLNINSIDTTRSIISKQIFEEFNDLKKSHYKNKIMILFSDMVEHNPEENLSFLSLNMDESNFQNIKNKIKDTYKIKIPSVEEFKDIKIFIIRPDHEKYRRVRLQTEQFWKGIFGPNCKFQEILNLN